MRIIDRILKWYNEDKFVFILSVTFLLVMGCIGSIFLLALIILIWCIIIFVVFIKVVWRLVK